MVSSHGVNVLKFQAFSSFLSSEAFGSGSSLFVLAFLTGNSTLVFMFFTLIFSDFFYY